MMPQDNVSKFIVRAHKKEDFSDVAHADFTLPINPESFSQNYKVEYDKKPAHGNQKKSTEYKFTTPEELKIDCMFDGTNAVEGYHNPEDKSVYDQIMELKEVAYDMNGEIHRPNFLKLFWGDLHFQGVLTGFDINYTLFNSKGKPLRAKVSLTFLGTLSDKERTARENKKSPDITHTRLIKEGDRLDLMTYNIYNDSKYVLQVSKANGLTSFRNPKVGKEYVFPPFDKTEA